MLLHSALVAAIVTTTAAIDHAAATSENESALKGRNLRTSTSGGKPSSSETKIDSIRKDNVKGDIFRIEAIEDDFDVVAGSGTVDLDVLLNDKLYRSDSMRDRDYMVITAAEGHDATGKDVCRPSGNHNVVKFDLKEADIGWNHCQYKVCYDDPRQASDEKLCDIARIEVYVEKKSRTPGEYSVFATFASSLLCICTHSSSPRATILSSPLSCYSRRQNLHRGGCQDSCLPPG